MLASFTNNVYIAFVHGPPDFPMATLSPFQLSLEQELLGWASLHWQMCAQAMFDGDDDLAYWRRCAAAILRKLITDDPQWFWSLLREREGEVRKVWTGKALGMDLELCLIAASMPPEVEWFTFVRWPDIPVPKVPPAKGKRVGEVLFA